MSDVSDRVRLREMEVLSKAHYTLRRATFDWRRSDGAWQRLSRESYDRGHGAAVLPVDRARGTVILVRQFRWPAYEAGYRETLIEAIAGLLDGDDPAACVAKEAMEEAGVAIRNVRRVFHCFMSPGAVTERLSLFVAECDAAAPRGKGGGEKSEGEDIEVLEMKLSDALAMAERGDICDAKTIMLLQWVGINLASFANSLYPSFMKLTVTKPAMKGLDRMPAKAAASMMVRLERIAADPFAPHPSVETMKGWKDAFRLRQGDWRAIYQVDRAADEMTVVTVDVRGSVYK